MSDETCLWCGRPAERLCDTLLHVEVELRRVDELGREREPKRRLLPISSWDIPTCDAPICSRCTTSQPVFDAANPPSYDERTETLDRCPYCVTQGPHAHLQVEVGAHRKRCREHGAAALSRYLAKPDAVVLNFPLRFTDEQR